MQFLHKLALAISLYVAGCGSSEAVRPMRDATDVTKDDAAKDGSIDGVTPPGDPRADAAHKQPEVEPLARFVYVGGWAEGAYPYRSYALDPASLALTQVGGSIDLGDNPSFTAASRDGRALYVANESWSGKPALTYAAIADDGAAMKRGEVRLPGAGSPVFTSLTPNGRFLLAADYGAGGVFVLRVQDGALAAVVDRRAIAGPGGESAQTHSVVPHPSGKWAYAPNKAIDRIAQYALDQEAGRLTPLDPPDVQGEDEPRLIAIHPEGALAYVMHERSALLVGYSVGEDGKLTRLAGQVGVTRTLPAGFSGSNKGAHLAIHPSGKYLYVSNRGHDSIAAFAIDEGGALRLLGHTPSGGRNPRHFELDARGELLVVANQGSEGAADGTLIAFAVGSDGKLSAPGRAVTGLPQPTSATLVTR